MSDTDDYDDGRFGPRTTLPTKTGDELVTFEAHVEHQTPKAYLVYLTTWGPQDAVWIPKSQIVAQRPTGENQYEFDVTAWIAKKNGIVP